MFTRSSGGRKTLHFFRSSHSSHLERHTHHSLAEVSSRRHQNISYRSTLKSKCFFHTPRNVLLKFELSSFTHKSNLFGHTSRYLRRNFSLHMQYKQDYAFFYIQKAYFFLPYSNSLRRNTLPYHPVYSLPHTNNNPIRSFEYSVRS